MISSGNFYINQPDQQLYSSHQDQNLISTSLFVRDLDYQSIKWVMLKTASITSERETSRMYQRWLWRNEDDFAIYKDENEDDFKNQNKEDFVSPSKTSDPSFNILYEDLERYEAVVSYFVYKFMHSDALDKRFLDVAQKKPSNLSFLTEEEQAKVIESLQVIALLIAIKQSSDFGFVNADFENQTGLTQKEISQMEAAFLKAVNFDLSI